MARHNYQVLKTGYFLAASGSGNIDLDCVDSYNMQVLVEVVYQATAGTTGVSLTLYGGLGNSDPDVTGGLPIKEGGSSVPKYADNGESVSMVTITPSSGSTVTKRTLFFLNDIGIRWPRWVRMAFVNNDASNGVTINLYADI